MKKPTIFMLLLTMFLTVLYVSPSSALFNSDVKKAREFMKAGMYPQAISLLEKRVNEKPTDEEAHYELGVCYINTGNFRGADQRFASAVKLEAEYGYKIGGEYKKAANESLKKNSVSSAISLFRKAIEFQPDLKDSIARECFDAGKSYLEKKQSKNADRLFSIAIKYNPALKDETDKVTREYGLKLLAIAKEKPKQERKPYVVEALKYIKQKDVDAVLPPPSLQLINKKTFVGNGMGRKQQVKTLEFGKDYTNGDKITVFGNKFLLLTKIDWEGPINGKRVLIPKTHGTGHILVKIPKGKKVSMTVERLIGSY